MPERLRLLVCFGYEVEFQLDFEFAPAGFGYFEGRGFDHAGGVGVGFVELELHFFEPVGYVGVVDAADVDGPLVGVFGGNACGTIVWVEGGGCGAVD